MTKEDVIYWFWFMTLVALMACGIMIIMAIDNDNQINKNKELTIECKNEIISLLEIYMPNIRSKFNGFEKNQRAWAKKLK